MDELDTLAKPPTSGNKQLFQRLGRPRLQPSTQRNRFRSPHPKMLRRATSSLSCTLPCYLYYEVTSLVFQLLFGTQPACVINQAPTLKCIIEIQMKLELTLDQTIYILNDILPGQLLAPSQTNDQHFKQFKFIDFAA
ncbi:hypothetical protein PGT21_026810 [Puccinia graminis f. sp. tritici]|uniref:Uncharacterized protein n=1 Tax=Puccinia graminis f. sp. tritici TaxID=56615 RepID=A0A5B0N7G9_PUCGR|nr:hypothetical protein PGT21_026810 [Puccinia graminis f. sp. tritici]